MSPADPRLANRLFPFANSPFAPVTPLPPSTPAVFSISLPFAAISPPPALEEPGVEVALEAG